MDLTRPLVVGYYVSDPYAPQLMNTAVVAVFGGWCRQEGYELGVPYRDNDGSEGAFDAMLGVLRDREDVAGVIVPTVAHLASTATPPVRQATIDSRRQRIAETGKALFVAYP